MSNFVNLLIAGLATGAIYAIIAIGFTLLWQTSQTINFAQGEFVMLPAFFILAVLNLGAPFWLAILVGFALSGLILGVLFKRVLVDPMLRHGALPLAIATMALAIAMREGVKEFYSAEAQPFPSIIPASTINLFDIAISVQSLGVLAAAIGGVLALHLLLNGTSLGHQMQATAQNPSVARIIGIPVERMIMLTFLINAALVAFASLLVTPIYLAKFSSGETLGLAAFIAAIIGGFNQVRGAIVGGLVLGVVEAFSSALFSSNWQDVTAYVVLDVVLMFRPTGLLGESLGKARA